MAIFAVFTSPEIGSGRLRGAEFEKRASQFSQRHVGMWVEQWTRGNTKNKFEKFFSNFEIW